MNKEAMNIIKVPVLGMSVDPECDYGFIVFAQSRATNIKFYEWLLKDYLIPWVRLIRTSQDIPDTCPFWYQLDREALQLEVFERADIIALLALHNIVVGKPPVSITEITQPSAASKCAFKHLPENYCIAGKELILKRVKDTIRSHHKE